MSDCGKLGMTASVSGEKNGTTASADHPAAPERGVAVVWPAAGEVLSRRARHVELVRAHALPPVQFGGHRHVTLSEPLSNLEWRYPFCARMSGGKTADSRAIQVVVMIV